MFCASSSVAMYPGYDQEHVQNQTYLPLYACRKNKKYDHHVKLSLNLRPDPDHRNDSERKHSWYQLPLLHNMGYSLCL